MLKKRVSERLRAKKGKVMNAKILAGIALVLALLVGGFAYVSSQSTGTVVAKSTPTPVATAAVPTQSPTPAPTTAAPTATPVPTPGIYSVKGVLTDGATGAAINGGLIRAYLFDPGLCARFNTGETITPASFVKTSSTGAFVLSVPAGTYIIFMNEGRSSQYWNGKPICQSADKLTVSGDMSLDIVFR